MNRKNIIGLALAGSIAASAAVMAAVVYDPEFGGFAGKGDVKDALGLSENDIRSVADSLVFTYEDEADYDVPCIKENTAQTLRNTFRRERGVNATVGYEARKNSQGVLTGFYLDAATGGDTPQGNIGCPGGWEADGDPVLVGSSGGGLYVNGVPLQ